MRRMRVALYGLVESCSQVGTETLLGRNGTRLAADESGGKVTLLGPAWL